jgi:hypothetical protein
MQMPISAYINSYLKESETEAKDKLHPSWLKDFFFSFHSSLDIKTKNSVSAGDRYFVASAFSLALSYLLPPGVILKREVPLAAFLSPETSGALKSLLSSKRIDFVLQSGSKYLFVEFKSNIQFNDVSAAMVEMAAVKKFSFVPETSKVFTGSLHLFPNATNVTALWELNTSLCSPLDFIWVLCKRGPLPKFDIPAINQFKEGIQNCLG